MRRIPQTSRAQLLAIALALIAGASSCSRGPVITPVGRTGIEGVVTIGPACPVQREDSPCPDTGYSARIEIRDATGRIVEAFISGPDGRFRVDLPPGDYTLVPQAGRPLPRAEPVPVTVGEGRYTRVDIRYDSGIR